MGASRFQRVEGSQVDWTVQQRASRPVQEYLVALESENSPTNPEREPKALSPCDPAAAWTTRGRHKVMFGYSLNYGWSTMASTRTSRSGTRATVTMAPSQRRTLPTTRNAISMSVLAARP